ncbi:hypothetical protein ABZ851_29990 [Streptomyces sp. NPDC047049]|uniref:hypothetical protein n=1 Tax=Streptomyces sp. NPDC047049 TaxID=3156688 RepID=UPI0033E84060
MLFLPQPSYCPGGPDGQGWNRLSLNAHFDTRHQCGLLPQNYAALWESMTGRQAWGGFGRCSRLAPGQCGGCRIQQLHMAHDGIDWPAKTPLLLARVRPLPPTPGSVFVNVTAGLSELEMVSWLGEPTGVEADWRTVRNTAGLRLGRGFRDADGEAFWLVRHNSAAASTAVRTRTYRTHTRHALYGSDGQVRLAVLTCHGRCTHSTYALEQLAADLADRTADDTDAAVPALPERLPGAPGVTFEMEDARITVHRHDHVARFAWDVPVDTATVTALAAHAVRLTST